MKRKFRVWDKQFRKYELEGESTTISINNEIDFSNYNNRLAFEERVAVVNDQEIYENDILEFITDYDYNDMSKTDIERFKVVYDNKNYCWAFSDEDGEIIDIPIKELLEEEFNYIGSMRVSDLKNE